MLICPAYQALPQPLACFFITAARSSKRLQPGRPPVAQESFGLGFRLVRLAALQDNLLLQTAAERVSYECGSGADSALVRGRLTKAMVRLKYATLTGKLHGQSQIRSGGLVDPERVLVVRQISVPRLKPKGSQLMRILHFTASAVMVVLVFYLLVVGESLLLPLVIAIALWYLINTLAQSFHRIEVAGYRLPVLLCRTAAVFTFLSLIWALINFLSASADEVLEVAPVYQENLSKRLQNLPFVDFAAFEGRSFSDLLTEWIDIPSYATSVASSFAGILASGGLILIYLGFLFLEQGHFSNKISALVANPEKESEAQQIIAQIRDDIQKYMSIKLFTSCLTGLASYLYLLAVGVDFAGLWGLLILLLNFIPTVGSIVATLFPALIALAQSDAYGLFLLVLLGIGVLQICIGNILEPRLMGSSFNLSPVVILLNLALWNAIWGIPGMFLCVPFLIIVAIILSHFPQTRSIAIMLSSDGNLRVPEDRTITNFSLKPSVSALLVDEGKTDGN